MFAKISEHGLGNAVDISTFRMHDGRVISVADAQDTSASSYTVCASFALLPAAISQLCSVPEQMRLMHLTFTSIADRMAKVEPITFASRQISPSSRAAEFSRYRGIADIVGLAVGSTR
jgi:hypothetical protein